jgi:hypothetical protein
VFSRLVAAVANALRSSHAESAYLRVSTTFHPSGPDTGSGANGPVLTDCA